MPGTYSWKIAALGKRVEVDVDEAAVSIRRPGREAHATVELARVTSVRVGSMTARYTTSRWCDFHLPGGRLRLACNSAGMDEHAAQYHAAVQDALRMLAAQSPEARVHHGIGRGAEWAMFGLGVTALTFVVGIPVAALFFEVNEDSIIPGVFVLLVLGVAGVKLVRSFQPWRDEDSVAASAYLEPPRTRPGSTPR